MYSRLCGCLHGDIPGIFEKVWCSSHLWVQVERESQVYESTLQKMNGQLESSLAIMAGEKAALQLSLTALQDQFEGVAQAVYSADDSVVGAPQQDHNLCTVPRKDAAVSLKSPVRCAVGVTLVSYPEIMLCDHVM